MANDLAPKDEEFEALRQQMMVALVASTLDIGKFITYKELFNKATLSAQEYFKLRGQEAGNE